jgi:hypothetical protein
MRLELEGLSETIKDYCRENYILSYTNKLQSLSFPEDKEYIKKLAERLLDWYDINYPRIEESKFVSNKEEHKKSISILQLLVSQIN